MDLTQKKILFIGPIFHDYHFAIISKLEQFGAEVTFYQERKYNLIFKLLNTFNKSWLIKYQRIHYSEILNKIKKSEFDYLLVIRGYMMPVGFMESIRFFFPKIKTIFYQWDSEKTNPFSHLVPYFDQTLTFDYHDYSTIKQIEYLPLFYTSEISKIRSSTNVKEKYDFFFVGWFLPERYEALMQFRIFAKENNYTIMEYIYIPFTTYVKFRLKGIKLDRSVLYFKPLRRNQYLDYLRESKAIVDVSNKNQSGLAIRIIEAIGAGKKVITNNFKIKNELLYSDEYICLISPENPMVPEYFLSNNEFSAERMNISDYYSLDNWINNLFCLKKNIKYLSDN